MSVATAMGGYGEQMKLVIDGREIIVRAPDWGYFVTQMEDHFIKSEVASRLRPFEIAVERGFKTLDDLMAETIKITQEVEDSGVCAWGGPKMEELLITAFNAYDPNATPEDREKAQKNAGKSTGALIQMFSLMTGLPSNEILNILQHPKKAEIMATILLVLKRSLPKGAGAAPAQQTPLSAVA